MERPDAWYEHPRNLVDLWEDSVAAHGDRPVFGTRGADGHFHWMTYRQTALRVDDVRAGLAMCGVVAGDAVGIIANNRPEWAMAAFATYGLGARFVPMYEAELPQIWRYILRDAGVKVLFVASAKVREALGDVSDLPALRRIVVVDGDGDDSLGALERAGRQSPVASIRPGIHDVASLIYTSGTTGDPKGVLLTHGNFTTNVHAGHAIFPDMQAGEVGLSILPWAHVYGQTAELYLFTSFGGAIGIAGGPTTVATDMAAVRPTYLIAVPRVFNRIYDAVWQKVREEGGLKLKLFTAAVEAARVHMETGKGGLKYRLLDRIVLQKVRDRFGGRFKGSLTGSAKMNPEIARFFFSLGMPCYDCYGLTETSPAVTMNCPAAHRLGTVGRPVEKVRVVIDTSLVDDGSGEGEIIVYGPNVMSGYHNKPEATAAVMTPDGGFRTGDRGKLDEDGFLLITGRFKEQYKLENGKYVFPAAVEEEIKRIPYVLNAMVFGEGRAHNECIVVPDVARLRQQAKELGLSVDPPELLFHRDDETAAALRMLIGKDIQNHLAGKFGSYEIPRGFHFVEEDFTVANGMLTQTLKLKRKAVLARFADVVAKDTDGVLPQA
jgi:long-chain acyl-CoA synthetase